MPKQDPSQRRFTLCTDCEGGPVLADHARELADHFIPNGAALFDRLSLYDDYVAFDLSRPGYDVGTTLSLLLPFLKANNLTDTAYLDYVVASDLQVSAGTDDATDLLRRADPSRFEITTTYRPFAEQVASRLGIPNDRVYATPISLDSYDMGDEEKRAVNEIATDIISQQLPDAEQSTDTRRAQYRGLVDFMEEIITSRLTPLSCASSLIEHSVAIGGNAKIAAIRDALARTQQSMEDVIFIGDSITDYLAFAEIREGGGVAISFNGSRFAIQGCTHACWGQSYLIAGVAAEICRQFGRDGLDAFCESKVSADRIVEAAGLERDYQRFPTQWGAARFSRDQELDIVEQSELARREWLGDDLGQLP